MQKTIYHIDHGPVEMYEIDANAAVQRFPLEWSEKQWTDEARAKAKAEAAKGSDTAENTPTPAITFEAKHRGGGSYSVIDSNGAEVLEKLSKEDADAFNKMSDEEKAEYVAAEKANS